MNGVRSMTVKMKNKEAIFNTSIERSNFLLITNAEIVERAAIKHNKIQSILFNHFPGYEFILGYIC